MVVQSKIKAINDCRYSIHCMEISVHDGEIAFITYRSMIISGHSAGGHLAAMLVLSENLNENARNLITGSQHINPLFR